jgi:hypothetical protein
MLSVSSLFAIANFQNFSRTVTCFDCFFPYGLPFTFFREGGYAGGGGLVWRGVVADCLVVSVCGIAVGQVWKRVSARRLQRTAKS